MAATNVSTVYSTQLTHIGSGASLAAGAMSGSADVSTALASTNLGRYPVADIQLSISHTTSISSASNFLILHRRDLNFDGTNDVLGNANNVSEALEKLRFTITSQIRPMMAEIASNQPKQFEVRNLKRFKSVKSSLPDRFTLRDKIYLGWSSFLETIGVSIWVWVYNSPNGILDNASLFIIYFGVLAVFKFLIPRKTKLPRFNAVFYTLIASLAASLSNVLYIFLVLGFDPGQSVMFAGFALLSGVIGPIILM